jgi:DNA-binding Lrp family transcriptional regulator
LRVHVESHPGERIEQIARALRRTTRELARPVRRLLEQGTIAGRGVGRDTRYYRT